ncbi:DUF7344 domain-containing protein [Halostella litorea]|uniref:DUF7344 domain-containing protein n=1 Tax=Halostella litorea TaxID=2528831 RepID=UPI001092E8B8|nr:hypothetical protein [Halostella litorea]
MSGDFLSGGPAGDGPRGSFLRGDGSDPLTATTIFELLADRRRRAALYRLADADGPVRFDALVEAVVDWESAGLAPPRGHEERVATALHHSHLPQLADAGVVDYDESDGVVRYRGSETLERYLDAARDDDA